MHQLSVPMVFSAIAVAFQGLRKLPLAGAPIVVPGPVAVWGQPILPTWGGLLWRERERGLTVPQCPL